MSSGFKALNNSNQVLISSDMRNLHFVQKITTPTVDSSTLYFGGVCLMRYRATCNVTPVPFFTCPTGHYYGITGVRNVGGNQWDIEMISSNYSSFAEVYIFSDPRGATSAETHGMLVYRDDATPAFDSRLRPLAVTGGVAVSHPYNPIAGLAYGLSSDNCGSAGPGAGGAFAPTQYNSYGVTISPSKPMFHYSSLAQAEREAHFGREEKSCTGFDAYGGCVGMGNQKNWDSYYWCFYRGGISVGNGVINAGWIAVFYGCHYTYNGSGSFIGIGTGSSGGSGGTWAYSNETLNLTSTSVIIGDASRYD